MFFLYKPRFIWTPSDHAVYLSDGKYLLGQGNSQNCVHLSRFWKKHFTPINKYLRSMGSSRHFLIAWDLFHSNLINNWAAVFFQTLKSANFSLRVMTKMPRQETRWKVHKYQNTVVKVWNEHALKYVMIGYI